MNDTYMRMRFDIKKLNEERERKKREDEIFLIESRNQGLEKNQLMEQIYLLMSYMSVADINDCWKACEHTLLKVMEDPDVKPLLKEAIAWETEQEYKRILSTTGRIWR